MSVTIETGFTGTTYGLDNPRIGWRRLTGTLAATASEPGYPAVNANTPRTDTFWKPSAFPGIWELTFPVSQNVSYIGIASHTLATNGCTVAAQTWNGSTWVPRATQKPTDNGPIFFLFSRTSITKARIVITGAAGFPLVGVVFVGDVTEWPRKATYAPSVSFERAKVTEYSTNATEGGQWAGRTIQRRMTQPRMTVDHLSEAWVASEFDAFAAYAETSPFFIADKPLSYPNSVAYAWAAGDLVPERAIANSDISNSVTLELMGLRV